MNIILTLTGGMVAAFGFGFLAKRLGLSPIVGYLLAGVLVGPYTPGFVADHGVSGQFSEIGVILMMFGVGLHFHVKDLLKVLKYSLPGALVQSLLSSVAAAFIMMALGWSGEAAVIFGISISVASTVVLTRVLEDNKKLHSSDGHIAIGWLVVEDILTILVLVLLPVLFINGKLISFSGEGFLTIGIALGKILILFLVIFFFGKKAVPVIFNFVDKMASKELFTLAILAIALGIAVGAAYFFGASMALGALLAGMIVGQSEMGSRAATDALPMRDAFAVLFFISIGMMFDPASLVHNWLPILITLGVVILGKPLFALVPLLLLRRPPGSALVISSALAQIGEFTFILATLSVAMGIVPGAIMSILVPVAIISIALNPGLFLLVSRMAAKMGKRSEPKTDLQEENRLANRVVLVGYGPTGQILHKILREKGLGTTIVELNQETVNRLTAQGIPAVFGNADDPGVLESAGIVGADALLISMPDLPGQEFIQRVKALSPQTKIIGRTSFISQVEPTKSKGADAIFSGEGEVAMAMSAHLMQDLGVPESRFAEITRDILKEIR